MRRSEQNVKVAHSCDILWKNTYEESTLSTINRTLSELF